MGKHFELWKNPVPNRPSVDAKNTSKMLGGKTSRLRVHGLKCVPHNPQRTAALLHELV